MVRTFLAQNYKTGQDVATEHYARRGQSDSNSQNSGDAPRKNPRTLARVSSKLGLLAVGAAADDDDDVLQGKEVRSSSSTRLDTCVASCPSRRALSAASPSRAPRHSAQVRGVPRHHGRHHRRAAQGRLARVPRRAGAARPRPPLPEQKDRFKQVAAFGGCPRGRSSCSSTQVLRTFLGGGFLKSRATRSSRRRRCSGRGQDAVRRQEEAEQQGEAQGLEPRATLSFGSTDVAQAEQLWLYRCCFLLLQYLL